VNFSLFNKLFCKQCFYFGDEETKVASLKSKLFEQIKSQGVVTEPYQVLNPVKWRIYKVFEANFEEKNLLQMLHGNKVYSDHCQVKSHTNIVSDCDWLLLLF
jgi:hypothetical protein